MNELDKRVIQAFVRGRLGCGCPPTVFDSIRLDRACGARPPVTRLLIGERLLIYLAAAGPALAEPGVLETVAERGRSERDSLGLNRFRLVLVTPDSRPSEAAAGRFAVAAEGDRKAHLHVVRADDVPVAIRPPEESAVQDKGSRASRRGTSPHAVGPR